MKRNILILLPFTCFFFALCFIACSQEKVNKNSIYLSTPQTGDFIGQLDTQIPQYLEEFIVPGAAVAIVKNGKVVLQKGYGLANVQDKIPVHEKTGFNVASISKTITAWGVMKLVEQNKLDLDSPAEKYLSRWHIPKSNFDANGVTIRRLLNHTSGLSLHGYSGFSPKDTLPTIEESLNGKTNGSGAVILSMEPGMHYRYSGGGYTLLQLIIEEVTGQRFEDYMTTEILTPLGMTNSSFKIDNSILAASSNEHNAYGKKIDFELFTAKAAVGFHTTIEDMAKFTLANLNPTYPQQVLKQSTLTLMTTPTQESQVNYGLGYQMDSYHDNTVKIVGHEGSNDGWRSYLQLNRETGDGIVILTNGASGDDLIMQVYCRWMNSNFNVALGNKCTRSIQPLLIRTYREAGIDATIAVLKQLKSDESKAYFYFERELNLFAYELLWDKKIDEANLFFQFMIEQYPHSPNTYYSYAEGLLAKGDTALSIDNYIRSINMDPRNIDPRNESALQIIEKLGVNIDRLFSTSLVNVSKEDLEFIKGTYTIQESQQKNNEKPWTISFEVENGTIYGNDRGYRYALIPKGDHKFRNPDDGSLIEFDLKNKKSIRMKLFDKYTFTKK